DTVHGRTRTETGRHCERTGNDMIMRVDGPFDFGVMYDFMERQDDCLYRTWDKKCAVRKALTEGGNYSKCRKLRSRMRLRLRFCMMRVQENAWSVNMWRIGSIWTMIWNDFMNLHVWTSGLRE